MLKNYTSGVPVERTISRIEHALAQASVENEAWKQDLREELVLLEARATVHRQEIK